VPCPNNPADGIPGGCPQPDSKPNIPSEEMEINQVPQTDTNKDNSKNSEFDKKETLGCSMAAGPQKADEICVKSPTPIQNQKNYDSGYSHGCKDAKITIPSQRYINQPNKGSNFHTNDFNEGYRDGFDACLKSGGANNCQNGMCTLTPVYPGLPTESNNNGKFVVKVKIVDDPNFAGPSDVDLYVKEYPQYSDKNIDLIDAMYDDDMSTPDGQYATQIEMPSGLIK